MSVLVQGLCYEIIFGCSRRKALAVALADHASHDGSKVFPAVALLARKIECSERTVQRTLRDLEALGILIVVNPGGAGPKDTREWCFDMQLLRELAAGEAVIEANKGDTASPLEGDSLSPLKILRVTNRAPKGDTGDNKGDTRVTRTITNHQEEPSLPPYPQTGDEGQGSGQSFENRIEVEVPPDTRPVATPQIRIKRGELHFGIWLDWIAKHHGDAVEAFSAAAMIVAASRMPRDDSPLPRIAGGRA